MKYKQKPHPYAQLIEEVSWTEKGTGRFYWQWASNTTDV